MLVLLTLFVLSAINSSTVNLRISSNTQMQDEARAAAQRALEAYVSVYANFYPDAHVAEHHRLGEQRHDRQLHRFDHGSGLQARRQAGAGQDGVLRQRRGRRRLSASTRFGK